MPGDDNASDQKLKYPFAITPVDPEISDEMSRDFAVIAVDGYVLIGPKKYCYTGKFGDYAAQLYNFQAQPDDIWVATFPRSGTTLTQELVWLIANDFDYERAQQQLLPDRFPYFESCIWERTNPNVDKWQSKSQRFFKTHLSLSLLPPSLMEVKAKTIYVARHPKDVIVSLYHLNKLYTFTDFTNNFAKFWDYFERDLIIYSSYFEHIKEGWNLRNEPNVLFLFYDELINNLPATIKKVATFLDKEINDDQLSKLLEHLKFENFRRNPTVNNQNEADNGFMNTKESSFIRRGKVSGNDWQPEYTPEIVARVEKWVEKNLRDTTLRFPEY